MVGRSRDLLASSGGDRHFVAEIDDDGRAQLRFGDGELGRMPARRGARSSAAYRIGNGPAGNVGRETDHPSSCCAGARRAPARSSRAIRCRRKAAPRPEPMAEARLLAPSAFRARRERAIMAEDYAGARASATQRSSARPASCAGRAAGTRRASRSIRHPPTQADAGAARRRSAVDLYPLPADGPRPRRRAGALRAARPRARGLRAAAFPPRATSRRHSLEVVRQPAAAPTAGSASSIPTG